MPQYGTGTAWTWNPATGVKITNSDWTSYAAQAAWTAAGYSHDQANNALTLVSSEQARLQTLWQAYGPRVLLKSLAASDFSTVPHSAQLLLATMGALSNGALGFREQFPAFIDETITPQFVRCGLFGVIVSEARTALGRPFLTIKDLQDDPKLCCDAALAILKAQASVHNWEPLQAAAIVSRGRLQSAPNTQTVWQLHTRVLNPVVTFDTELTRMAAWMNACPADFIRARP